MCSLASPLTWFLHSVGEKPSAGSGSEEVDELKVEELKVEELKVEELKVVELKVVKVENMSVLAGSGLVWSPRSFDSFRCALKNPRSAMSESWIFDLSRCKISSVSFVKEMSRAATAQKPNIMPKRIATLPKICRKIRRFDYVV